jgi:hypothetical protein
LPHLEPDFVVSFSSSCWPKIPSLPVWSLPYLKEYRLWDHQHTIPRSLSV